MKSLEILLSDSFPIGVYHKTAPEFQLLSGRLSSLQNFVQNSLYHLLNNEQGRLIDSTTLVRKLKVLGFRGSVFWEWRTSEVMYCHIDDDVILKTKDTNWHCHHLIFKRVQKVNCMIMPVLHSIIGNWMLQGGSYPEHLKKRTIERQNIPPLDWMLYIRLLTYTDVSSVHCTVVLFVKK